MQYIEDTAIYRGHYAIYRGHYAVYRGHYVIYREHYVIYRGHYAVYRGHYARTLSFDPQTRLCFGSFTETNPYISCNKY